MYEAPPGVGSAELFSLVIILLQHPSPFLIDLMMSYSFSGNRSDCNCLLSVDIV
jgi:hypothetical protein